MFLSIWHEYYEFFIIIGSLIFLMLIVYLIFFRPRSPHNKQEKEKLNNIEEANEDISLNDDFSESELDDEFISKGRDEYFVLGENSNILESLHNKDSEKEEVKSKQADIEIENDHKITDEIFNDFKTIDQLIEEQETISVVPDHFENKLDKAINIDDHEKVLTEIVNSVIQKDEFELPINGKYHVLYNKEESFWYVKREGTTRIEKRLVTQKEAIAYATIQALQYDTTIVVHDEDGKIGKYEF